MKILYVAIHGDHDNKDEDSIAWSLEQLGHEVTRVPQKGVRLYFSHVDQVPRHDFVLFHKWEDVDLISNMPFPRICWYFDLVQSADFTEGAGTGRVEWAKEVERHCRLFCCTDGDWASLNPTMRKHLCQGMDERVAGFGEPTVPNVAPIIFVGTVRYSKKRTALMELLKARYGDQFAVMGEHARTRLHGRALANLYASTKICIAPDNATEGWWSNRVWNTLGLGGFLLHPYVPKLRQMYPAESLCMYASREQLYAQIDCALNDDDFRKQKQINGLFITQECHTYKHRCAKLIKLVEERL